MKGALVCVTGATGFIGSHVVADLLANGYRVRATVRDPANQSKAKHLFALPGATDRLELAYGDLGRDGSFDEAIRDVRFVIHTASAVVLAAKDKQREIVDVAVDGTKRVTSAALASPSVERIVLTSSVAAVCGQERRTDHLFTEVDWNDFATVDRDAYATSKVKAERAFRDLVARAPRRSNGQPLRASAIHPSLVLGPVLAEQHLRTSPAFLFELLKGNFPGVPDFRFDVVDVRDAARAHVRALEVAEPSERYITTGARMGLREMADLMRTKMPGEIHKLPRLPLPDALMYLAAVFDARVTFRFLRNNLGHAPHFDNTRVRRELGVEFRPTHDTVLETARSITQGGYL